jgi:rSAM/selenodomain-associated transferase 2
MLCTCEAVFRAGRHMPNHTTSPELSIIVPVINERHQLPAFLADLGRQQALDYELLICDGGSDDGTLEWLKLQQSAFDFTLLTGPAGRARQLNQGIAAARGSWLLLLHVDSRFADDHAIRQGLDALIDCASLLVAGHFALRFRRTRQGAERAFYFYEWKARLGRADSIHGDQGFLLPRQLMARVGAFDQRLPAMEDSDFAERLRELGQWRLLPAEISTSARRFEVEGLWQRQLLGALMMCFRSLRWQDFFAAAPDVYRQQAATDRLRVSPFLQLIRQLLQEKPLGERCRLWYRSGWYVNGQLWQLFLALDARRCYRRGIPLGQGRSVWLDSAEPLLNWVLGNPLGRLATTVALRLCFSLLDRRLKWRWE